MREFALAGFTKMVYYGPMKCRVEISRRAEKQLRKVPQHVVDKLLAWVQLAILEGLAEARKIPGYHDEPLRGERAGQRSIRLSRAYRAIYVVDDRASISFVVLKEVSKHDY